MSADTVSIAASGSSVQKGETLDRISARHYGDSTKWRLIADANGIIDPLALRPGGLLAAYTPSIVQAQQIVQALDTARLFVQVETLETFYRPWHIENAAVRPVQQMVAHTAFMTFARLIAPRAG